MARICLLPDELVNKIAAGEVVERPASVVKELVENALDAGARSVRVALREGGLTRISVTDDGSGMAPDDARMSLIRHATSKLRDLNGLFAIDTNGFRGEALPAIASVSRLTLSTCEREADEGVRLWVEGGVLREVSSAPPLPGTSLEVEDLFYNTPARRKFLKRPSTELAHCQDAVVRLALSHPEVAFHLEHDGHTRLSVPARLSVEERLVALLGREEAASLAEAHEARLGVFVRGFVSRPPFSLSTARGLYCFVNRRYVRDRGLNHAIGRALSEVLPPGRHPLAVLSIELSPSAVDVNVHPQKLEVRFADPREVHDAVFAAVRRTLPLTSEVARPLEVTPAYVDAVDRFLSVVQAPRVAEPGFGAIGLTATGLAPARESLPEGAFRRLRVFGALSERFLVCEAQGKSLVVLDVHAALERVRLAELERRVRDGRGPGGQASIFSTVVTLEGPGARSADVLARRPALERLGFELSPFGANAVVVSAAPIGLPEAALEATLRELVDRLSPHPPSADPTALEGAMAYVACCAARPPGSMSHDATTALLEALEAAEPSVRAIHPLVLVHELPLLELERRAERAGQQI